MAYAERLDFIERHSLRELEQLEHDRTGAFELAIVSATALVNSYLSARYAVPVSGVPVLKQISLDIARFILYDDSAPEVVETRRDNAVAWLRDIAAGKVMLTDEDGNEPALRDDLRGGGIPTAASKRALIFGSEFEARYQ